MKNIYLATSWRNGLYYLVRQDIINVGFDVYDFKKSENAFHWREIDPKWKNWTPVSTKKAYTHPLAQKGFTSDFQALQKCDALVLLLPCGKSAHLEAGYVMGQGKPVFILDESGEPELMYSIDHKGICVDHFDLMDKLKLFKEEPTNK